VALVVRQVGRQLRRFGRSQRLSALRARSRCRRGPRGTSNAEREDNDNDGAPASWLEQIVCESCHRVVLWQLCGTSCVMKRARSAVAGQGAELASPGWDMGHGPIPQGEGETFAAGREFEASRFLPTRRRIFPLPEGEGQGEGERRAETSEDPKLAVRTCG